MKISTLVLMLLFPLFIFADSTARGDSIIKEYESLRDKVQQIKEDKVLGFFYKVKTYDSYDLIWSLGESEEESQMIRFFHRMKDMKAFSVTYYLNSKIIPGKKTLRRTVALGYYWFNETIDYTSGAYLESQGVQPNWGAKEKELLKLWGVEL